MGVGECWGALCYHVYNNEIGPVACCGEVENLQMIRFSGSLLTDIGPTTIGIDPKIH